MALADDPLLLCRISEAQVVADHDDPTVLIAQAGAVACANAAASGFDPSQMNGGEMSEARVRLVREDERTQGAS